MEQKHNNEQMEIEPTTAAIAANLMLAAALSGGGNEIIAKFMGLRFHKVGWVDSTHIDGNYECEELKYNYSWAWLMPVIEKIESLWIGHSQPRCKIEGTYCQIADSGGYYAKNSDLKKDNQLGGACYPNNYTKIENTYRMVVEFIKWYNQQGVSEGIR
jgi:hypothetical protein